MSDDSYKGVAGIYEHRRNVFVEALAQEGWVVPQPKVTMFIWTPLPCSDFIPRSGGSREFARELLLKAGVALIPGDAFGSQGGGTVLLWRTVFLLWIRVPILSQ